MKKILLFGALAVALMSFVQDTAVIGTEEGMTVVNTTSLCSNVHGYDPTSPVPVKIYIKDNKIVKVKPLRNKETPQYFQKVKQQMLPKWVGMTTQKAATAKVDGVTGATMSSKAVLKNVQAGAAYYNKNKK